VFPNNKRRRHSKQAAAAILLFAVLAQGCVGSPPPPRKDLFSAVEKSASGGEMFQFWSSGILVLDAASEDAADRLLPLAEYVAEGSSRAGKGYRMTLRKRPAVWRATEGIDAILSGQNVLPNSGEAETWLSLEEVPGAVRAPGQPLWFSGRSGLMDPFGALAHALPPLGSPDTVFDRLRSLLSLFKDPELAGQAEVRGHPVDVYTLSVSGKRALPPKEAVEKVRKPPSVSQSPTLPSPGSPSPSPTALDGLQRLPLPEAVWLFVNGRKHPDEVTAVQETVATYSLTARVYVDQIDNRLRRVEVTLGVSGTKFRVRVESSAEFWGFDPVGEFKIPVDTTFVSPDGQTTIARAGFEVLVPSNPPAGLEFTGLERRPDANRCEPLTISYTGRGRSGHLKLIEVPSGCEPSTSIAAQSGPAPSTKSLNSGSVSLTDTPFGSRIFFGSDPTGRVAIKKTQRSWVTAHADEGISVEELFEVVDGLAPIRVPIPPELSLPLPPEGPERR